MVASVLALAALGALLGLAFAGSPARLAEGVSIDGVDVGGMEPAAARRLLERRADSVESPLPILSSKRTRSLIPYVARMYSTVASDSSYANKASDGENDVKLPSSAFRGIS